MQGIDVVLHTATLHKPHIVTHSEQDFIDANIKANELLYRRVDIQDVVDAHLIAIQQASKIGFGRYIISGTTPFTTSDLKDLYVDAPRVLSKYHADFSAIYADKEWSMFSAIGRVYINDLARKVLGWQPKYDFQWVLDCLKKNKDFRSPLAIEIGVRGYHVETFEEGPYFVNPT